MKTYSTGFILPIRRSLINANVSGLSVAAPKSPPRLFNGKNEVARPGDPQTDRLILEMRRLYEQCQLKPNQIHESIHALGFAKTKSWVFNVLNYYTRSHLVPALGSASYLEHQS